MISHTDRGELARPVRTASGRTTFEGRAARVHLPGDALVYSTGEEHRDASELASIARQLATGRVPVTMAHPSTMPAASARDAWIVGFVTGARVDGDHVVATLEITDPRALKMIDDGVRELSLGYETDLDARRFQRSIKVDHLALVEHARCGTSCAIRADAFRKGNSMCTKASKLDALDSERRARLDAAANTATAWIGDHGERELARQRYIERELARLDAAGPAGGPNLDDADPEKQAAARSRARLNSAWKTDGDDTVRGGE